MKTIENYALGSWIQGDGQETPLYNAINGDQIGTASSKGLDFSEMMNYARKVGGPALRKMTFQERGLMLKKLALHLHSIKGKFYPISFLTGATKVDSWIDCSSIKKWNLYWTSYNGTETRSCNSY